MKKLSLLVVAAAILIGAGLFAQGAQSADAAGPLPPPLYQPNGST